jgi:hypothetical protein
MSSKSVPGDGTHASGTKGGSLEWFGSPDAKTPEGRRLGLRDMVRMAANGIRSLHRAAPK